MVTVFRVLGGLISAYMLLLFIRILLTWFQGAHYGKPYELLIRITDPYLMIFRKVKFLRSQRMDFSPILALITLVIVLNIVNTIAAIGTITIGIILAIIVSALWSAVSFLFTLFIILIFVRLIAHLFGANSVSPFIQTLDMIINPVMGWMMRKIFRGKPVTYRFSLGLCGGILIVVFIAGEFIITQLVSLLRVLPI